MAQALKRWDIFCHVVDNYGDIGISWRLARQLRDEYGLHVRLWIDDMQAASAIIPALRARLKPAHGKPQSSTRQDSETTEPVLLHGIMLCQWPQPDHSFSADDIADVVIESLGCELPAQYVEAMAKQQRTERQTAELQIAQLQINQMQAAQRKKTLWINLEYLSAESWVDDFHAKNSLHSIHQGTINQCANEVVTTLQKHFFFPGFTPLTGGLLREQPLITVRNKFQRSATTQQAFWASLGLAIATQAPRPVRIISLFCYAHAPLPLLLDSLARDATPSFCIVPGNNLLPALWSWFDKEVVAEGLSVTDTPAASVPIMRKGNLSVQVVPFLSQVEYDRLLWACDLNVVRGEDSWVRAIWSGKPFLWQPYKQEQDAHLTKLHAFLDVYCDGLQIHTSAALRNAHVAWCDNSEELENETATLKTNPAQTKASAWAFEQALASLTEWEVHSHRMSQRLAKQADLAAKLVIFCRNQL